jgi:hypothetical protein
MLPNSDHQYNVGQCKRHAYIWERPAQTRRATSAVDQEKCIAHMDAKSNPRPGMDQTFATWSDDHLDTSLPDLGDSPTVLPWPNSCCSRDLARPDRLFIVSLCQGSAEHLGTLPEDLLNTSVWYCSTSQNTEIMLNKCIRVSRIQESPCAPYMLHPMMIRSGPFGLLLSVPFLIQLNQYPILITTIR